MRNNSIATATDTLGDILACPEGVIHARMLAGHAPDTHTLCV